MSWTLLPTSSSSRKEGARVTEGADPGDRDLTDGSNKPDTSLRGSKRLHDEDDSANEENRFPPRTRKRVRDISFCYHLFTNFNLG